MLKHCPAYRMKRLSALPNVGPYIYDVKISGFTRSSIYIDISRLRVKGEDSRGDHGLSSLVELRFKAPPGTPYSCITIHPIGTT
jgi:hypothetical protein